MNFWRVQRDLMTSSHLRRPLATPLTPSSSAHPPPFEALPLASFKDVNLLFLAVLLQAAPFSRSLVCCSSLFLGLCLSMFACTCVLFLSFYLSLYLFLFFSSSLHRRRERERETISVSITVSPYFFYSISLLFLLSISTFPSSISLRRHAR